MKTPTGSNAASRQAVQCGSQMCAHLRCGGTMRRTAAAHDVMTTENAAA
jgi:hypothetical protein